MQELPVYFRNDIQVEPLVDQWYAWSHLIPPATAARNLTERHMAIMNSYINAPQVHAKAILNPAMIGGPFINYGGKRVEEITRLRDLTKRARVRLIELSAGLAELDKMLRDTAKGFSLQTLYPGVPDCLRGYVELVYDLNNQPSFRLIEPLLYSSPLYDRSSQSVALSVIEHDDRSFVLSTPRLQSKGSVTVNVPFDDSGLDRLFELKTTPAPWSTIRAMLDIDSQSEDLFNSYFTPQQPPSYLAYNGNGVRWRYFGHACILVEWQGLAILLDPVISYRYDCEVSRYTYADLPDTIDYVLITHNHQDHISLETLLQLRGRIKQIVVPKNGGGALQDPSLRLLLNATGFHNVMEIAEMERIELPDGEIIALPFLGEHSDLDVLSKLGYLVRRGCRTLAFVADSCNIEPRLYQHISRAVGKVDALFIGMECEGAPLSWLYGPLLTQPISRSMDNSRRLNGSNCEQSIGIIESLGCQQVYVYAMGQEPWLRHIMSLSYTTESTPIVESDRLIAHCRGEGISAERLFGEKELFVN